ncbi:MAG: sugar transferase [Lachnospiraceae bacterium]|nr:sugar transferase [Lachnospiraceae bacterium]
MITKKSNLVETYSLILIDVVAVVLAFVIAYVLRFSGADRNYRNVYYLVSALVIIVAILYGVMSNYNREFFVRGYFVEFVALLKYEIVLLVSLGTFVFLLQAKLFSRLVFLYFGIANFILTYLFHTLLKKYMMGVYRKSDSADKVLIVTESKLVDSLLEGIKETVSWNYSITSLAFIDYDNKPETDEEIDGIPVVAGINDLYENATTLPLDVVFISLPNTPVSEIKEILENFETMGVTCHYNVEREELNLKGKTAGNFAGYTVMTFSLNYMDYRRVLIKKVVDIIGAIVGLLITAVVTPFVALAIKIESKGPVFYKQERVGKNGRRFKLYKFRSMYIDADERKSELMKDNEVDGLMFKIKDDPRVTKVGKFIRKTSIDEMPQFLNVLKGDMSLVGTRPPTIDEFEKYNVYYRRRLSITPGLTGMWQVSGRSDIDNFDEVVKLDLQYIENWTLSLDFKILLQTVGTVLFGRGAK